MLTHILVPLDGSALAREALDAATQIVDSTCKITLVMVIQEPEIPAYAASPVSINPEYYPTLAMLEADGKQYLEEIVKSLRQQGYHASSLVEIGDPSEGIILAADELDVELIVMSTHGRTGVKRWLFGSVANRVFNTSKRPVLVIPSRVVQEEHEREVAELNPGW